mgnify:CR=1 FL=1
MSPHALLISPGPGNPKQAGISVDLIKWAAGKIPVLGICYGLQLITSVFGGKVQKVKKKREFGRALIKKKNKIDFDIEEVGQPIPFIWGKCKLATSSFGHGITTTPLCLYSFNIVTKNLILMIFYALCGRVSLFIPRPLRTLYNFVTVFSIGVPQIPRSERCSDFLHYLFFR